MSEHLTKQGVRNLDSPTQQNQRRRSQGAVCFHDWEYYCDDEITMKKCRRCGETKKC